MVEGTENKLTHIKHIMKAINLTKGFHISLSTTRHRLSARYCTYSFFSFLFFYFIYFNRIFPADLCFYIDQKLTDEVCCSSREEFCSVCQKKKKRGKEPTPIKHETQKRLLMEPTLLCTLRKTGSLTSHLKVHKGTS